MELEENKDQPKEAETIIFCIDLSGSMETTVKKLSDKEKKQKNFEYNYMSRLDCVKEAITEELSTLNQKKPNAKVGLVVFGSCVQILGDCKEKPHEINGKMH